MGLIQAIAGTSGLRQLASMAAFGLRGDYERASDADLTAPWWDEPADVEAAAEPSTVFLVCQQVDARTDGSPVFGRPFASDDDSLALSEDGYLINSDGHFLLGMPLEGNARMADTHPQVVRIDACNVEAAAATTRIRYRVNLPSFPMTANACFDTPGAELLDKTLFGRDPSAQGSGAVLGDDRMKFFERSLAGGSVQVHARDGRPVQLVFRWAKIGSQRSAGRDTWNLFYRIRRDARPREIAWKNTGQNFIFAADGRLEDGAQVVPLLDLNVDGVRLGNVSIAFGNGGLTQFADRAGLVKVLDSCADGSAGGEFTGISLNVRGRLLAHYATGATRPVADIHFTGDEPWFTTAWEIGNASADKQVA